MSDNEVICWALKGNEQAVGFIESITQVAHLWDDLIDRDRPVSADEIHAGFWAALVSLPRNPFYQAHLSELGPLVASGIVNWRAANALEASGADADLDIAFICRSDYVNLVLHCALLIGGQEWAVAVAPAVRRQCHHEGRAGYRSNLAAQAAATGD